MQQIPMCWKCCDGLFAKDYRPNAANPEVVPFIYKGCKADARITTYDDAKLLCPILPKAIDVEVVSVTVSPTKRVTRKHNRKG